MSEVVGGVGGGDIVGGWDGVGCLSKLGGQSSTRGFASGFGERIVSLGSIPRLAQYAVHEARAASCLSLVDIGRAFLFLFFLFLFFFSFFWRVLRALLLAGLNSA